MLLELSVLSSGFRFNDSNYNYTNTNTNVSSHLCSKLSINLAHMAKNNKQKKSIGTGRENDLLIGKA